MKTNMIDIDNNGIGADFALTEVERFAGDAELSPKGRIHIRLLTEELLGMVRTIGGEFESKFWVEGNSSCTEIHLSAKMKMSLQKREELLKVSTSGKNAAYSGVMDRIKEEMEIYLLSLEEGAEDSVGVDYGVDDLIGFDSKYEYKTPQDWKLSEYKGSVERQRDSERIAEWDQLEKSIVANLADEVSVGIRGDRVEVVITKKF